ncbi:putative histidinol dehydrogenase [Helianthus annuus]|uniref:Histidinol dehydrogenase n=3 Tax=Helianthus annuus TaxID=4232 RepID=A0A9K3DGL1_HELAN|nr:putative histidinol dehydrogenase [Helianthus annuus]KAJ0812725.1 putative histidinol dehydrogenase [Helianthus annuus]
MKGVRCKRVARSIASVGLYVPGGTAVLPSTALMLAVPAQIAGCKTIVLATPPSSDGSICKEVLYCAKKAGVTHILRPCVVVNKHNALTIGHYPTRGILVSVGAL